jgi:Outer membrane protein beta-barrel domain
MRKVCLLLILLVVPSAVFAQDWRDGGARDRYNRRYPSDNRFELTPFGGYRWGGTLFADTTTLFNRDVDAESSGDFGLNFGIPIGYSNMKLELMVNHQATHLTTGSAIFEPNNRLADFDVTYYHAGLMIPFAESRNVTPFVVLSAGVGNLDPKVSGATSSNRFSGSAGVGVKVPVNDNFGVRVETRGYFTSLGGNNGNDCRQCSGNNNGHDFYQGEVNVGFVISF